MSPYGDLAQRKVNYWRTMKLKIWKIANPQAFTVENLCLLFFFKFFDVFLFLVYNVSSLVNHPKIRTIPVTCSCNTAKSEQTLYLIKYMYLYKQHQFKSIFLTNGEPRD